MRTFEEWLRTEKLDEGWGKNLAIGAALAAGAMGLAGRGDVEKSHDSSKHSQADDFQRGDSLGKAFGRQHRQRSEKLQQKAQQLRDAGRTSGNFVHGKLQDGKGEQGASGSRKSIQNTSITFK